jgi:hypothetical protein
VNDAPHARPARRDEASTRLGVESVLSALCVGLGVVLVGMFAYAVLVRAKSPADAEWMTGAIRDHVERARDGLPIYAAPSARHVAFVYPPLYYWLSGALARFVSVSAACRAVSVGSTLAAAAGVFAMARSLGTSRFWAACGALLYLGSYSFTSFFFDLERVDALFVALVTWASVLSLRARTTRALALAAGLFGAAFLAKQMAVAFVLVGAIGFALSGRRRDSLVFLGAGALVVVVEGVALHAATGGWWTYYCLRVPRAHGLDSRMITAFFVFDLAKGFLLTLATAYALGVAGSRARGAWPARRGPSEERESLVRGVPDRLVPFGALLAAALLASASARLHLGGWPNVIMPWTCFASVAVAVLGDRVDGHASSARVACRGVLLLQLMGFVFDPTDAIPRRAHEEEARDVTQVVRELERGGEVVLVGRGQVTSPRHLHLAALVDVLRAGGELPRDLVEGLEARRYAAYIIDEPYELSFEPLLGHKSELFALVMQNYYFADRFDRDYPEPAVGFHAHPTWILKPRARPLPSASVQSLEHLQTIEMGLAEARMQIRKAGVDPGVDDVEARAAALLGLYGGARDQ